MRGEDSLYATLCACLHIYQFIHRCWHRYWYHSCHDAMLENIVWSTTQSVFKCTTCLSHLSSASAVRNHLVLKHEISLPRGVLMTRLRFLTSRDTHSGGETPSSQESREQEEGPLAHDAARTASMTSLDDDGSRAAVLDTLPVPDSHQPTHDGWYCILCDACSRSLESMKKHWHRRHCARSEAPWTTARTLYICEAVIQRSGRRFVRVRQHSSASRAIDEAHHLNLCDTACEGAGADGSS
jgi:hypothetical protein